MSRIVELGKANKYIILILVVMWIGFMVFFYLKADEITKDPCSICAKRMGKEVTCTTEDYIRIKRVYYPNGTIYDDNPDIKYPYDFIEYNLSEIIVEE